MRRTASRVRAAIIVCAGAFSTLVLAATSTQVPMETHAAFFSRETGQAKVLDPQVFVRDAQAPAATGPQNIEHRPGVRNALAEDPPGSPLFTATGEPMGMTLGQWLHATGRVTLTPAASGKEQISVEFLGLKPGGMYSLFENHFDQKPVGFTPLDGAGTGNSFKAGADGKAAITVVAPERLTHANAVLLVYHWDKETHGASRGKIGISAQHQLIARVPQ